MAATDRRDAVRVVQESEGLPIYGTDATGAASYATVVTATRACHYAHVSVEDNGALVSFDGSTNHVAIPANTERLFPGLRIANAATVKSKNIPGGSGNYTNLRISIW